MIFDDGTFDTNVYDRDELTNGNIFIGPALIEEKASVSVIRPGYKGFVDEYGNLRISKK